jgi:HK97 gp10 family phage protein
VIRISVSRNDFAKIAESLRTDCADAVAETGLEIEDGAKRRSRVKTGTMRRGWRMLKDNQGGRRSLRAVIGNPVPYAIYNQFGTAHMAAQPMIIPEVEIARPKFEQRVRDALKP